jgi:purine nucleosidase
MSSLMSEEQAAAAELVVFDNDAGKDDIVTLIVLMAAHVRTAVASSSSSSTKWSSSTGRGDDETTKKPWRPLRLLGLTLLDGDSFIEPAADAMRRMLALASAASPDLQHVPVLESPLKCSAQPFPTVWRRSSVTIDFLPVLNSPFVTARLRSVEAAASVHTPGAASAVSLRHQGHEGLAVMVMQEFSRRGSRTPITLLATGPLSNVAHCIDKYGAAFTDCVGRLVVMGGAVHVDGNVWQEHIGAEATIGRSVDGSAEWNIFWAASAARKVLCQSVFASASTAAESRIVLFALDATNSVPITADRVREFGKCRSRVFQYAGMSRTIINDGGEDGEDSNDIAELVPPVTAPFAQIAGTCWSIVPWYPRETAPAYYAFDVLTAAFLVDPTICDLVPTRIGVIAEPNHPSEGRTYPVDLAAADGVVGTVLLAKNVNQQRFYEIMYDACSL